MVYFDQSTMSNISVPPASFILLRWKLWQQMLWAVTKSSIHQIDWGVVVAANRGGVTCSTLSMSSTLVTILLALVWETWCVYSYSCLLSSEQGAQHQTYWWNWWKHQRCGSNSDVCNQTNWHIVWLDQQLICSLSILLQFLQSNFPVTPPHSFRMSAWSSIMEIFLFK